MTLRDSLLEEAHLLVRELRDDPGLIEQAVRELAANLDQGQGDAEMTEAAVHALAEARDPSAAKVLLGRVRVDDPAVEVRLALARALPGCTLYLQGGALRARTIRALTALTHDDVPSVRDAAAFGLAQLEADTPAARDALAARLSDPDSGVRGEALLALARTGDVRARHALLRRLEGAGAYEASRRELEAAAALADPVLYPRLQMMEEEKLGDEDAEEDVDFWFLRRAVGRCHPDAAKAAARGEHAALERIEPILPAGVTVSLVGAYPRTVLVVAMADGTTAVRLALWSDNESPWTFSFHYPVSVVCSAMNLGRQRRGSQRRASSRRHA